ncbi:MAG: polyhydroxyalkanoate synthesis regulator DNA-binding domain-containing protein [Chloroflexia bacterium]
MQTVRRYANRKFYHVEGHRYIRLQEIADLLRAGEEVRVYTHPDGKDVTPQVLARIIVQEGPAGWEGWLVSLICLGRASAEEAGRFLLAHLGLPTRDQWRRLEAQVARLEALLSRLLDEEKRPVL